MKLSSAQIHAKLLRLAAFAAVIIAAQSCAYYNTFYNTKKFYKEALDEYKRRTGEKPLPSETQKYDKTIEKASKVLQLHPNSRYVDDALMIIGECFYYKQEYLKAQRKFLELITIFPKSGLAPRAQLWLAKTNIELNDYAGAERVLKELQQRRKKGEIANQAQYFLGEIYFRQKQYIQAAREFEVAVRQLDDEKMRGEAYMRLGECCVALKQYDLAAGAFRRAGSAAKNEVNFAFQARLQYAKAQKNNGHYDEALTTLNRMLKEFSNHRDLPLAKLEIAECTLLQGKVEAAIKLYTAIIENHQRTEASAAAFFALGEIYERHFSDFNKAKENFDNVRRESARSEKVTEAGRRSKAIGELIKTKETIATLEKQIASLQSGGTDSLSSASASKEKKKGMAKHAISHIPNRKGRKARTAVGTPTAARTSGTTAVEIENKIAEMAKNKILLAELYLFHFNRPDSAMREYLDVFEFFPKTEYAPQAMYSLAYLVAESPATSAMRDSVLQVLADRYGDSPQGRAAKRRLGRPDTVDTSSHALNLFRQAEDHLFNNKNPQSALRLYQEFLQRQPDSKLAPQSLYAMGWIYEHELADNQQAIATYKKLIETYPDTPFAKHVRSKLTAVEKNKSESSTTGPTAPAGGTPEAKGTHEPTNKEMVPPGDESAQPKPMEDEPKLESEKAEERGNELIEKEPPPF